MTELIAQLKQIAIGDGLKPTHVYVMARVAFAFIVGVVAASLFI